MKIAITWDYELFFGSRSGTVDKCMLEPTKRILEVAEKHEVPFTFFPDVGSLLRFQDLPEFSADLHAVISQVQQWDSLGHETGLHIHPHWEKSVWENEAWRHPMECYKLSDFTDEEAKAIVLKYHAFIQSKVTTPILSYRAGGWCVQPFSRLASGFDECGIRYDSSVFKQGKNTQAPYQYDFTKAPNLPFWHFESDELLPVVNAKFTEFPIASRMYSPLFFWKLFVLGRLNPRDHKGIGNGVPAAGGGSKFDLLTRAHRLCVSVDGYYASKLQQTLHRFEKKQEPILVVIGHPKALTHFGLSRLDAFIQKNKEKHEFVKLQDLT